MMRYARAFMAALAMTLRGERLDLPPGPISEWVRAGDAQLEALLRAAHAEKLDLGQVSVRVDGRPLTMRLILTTIQHHLRADYPYILRNPTAHALTGIRAQNLNDCYWLERLEACPDLTSAALKARISRLRTHLSTLPVPASQ